MSVMRLLLAFVLEAAFGATTPAFGQVVLDLATLRPTFEAFFESRREDQAGYGQYKMRSTDAVPAYYASLDVAMARTNMGEDFAASLSDQRRTEWIDHLHTYAQPDGTYSATFGHNQLHANGMTIGGLGPLGGKQKFPAGQLYAPFDEVSEVPNYLANNINWTNQWGESHKFWGGLHVYSFSQQANPEWRDAVFNWLDSNVDPTTGWFRIGQQPSSDVQGLGGGAHVWPIYEHWGHSFPEPERVIDRILGMQLVSGRFGNGNSGYMDLDALYGLKYMSSLSPTYRADEVTQAAEDFGTYLAGSINSFLAAEPTLHETLAKVSGFGVLHQLLPEQFPDSTGVAWSDIFTDARMYATADVETFAADLQPIGADTESVYSTVVTNSAPVAYWRLGQTGGLVASADAAEHLNGYYVGLGDSVGPGNLGQPGPRPADGLHGMPSDNRAVHLDGGTSYVSVPNHEDLQIGGELTLEAWIRLDQLPSGNAGIVAKYEGSGSQRSYNLYVHAQNGGQGALGMVVSPDGTFGSALDMVDTTPLPMNEWLHVTGVFKPDEYMRLYVNGQLVEARTEGTTDIPTQIHEGTADLWIGAQFSSDQTFRFPGSIDEVAVYARAFSGDEVLSHYLAAVNLPGDYNEDGYVNLADYTVWRDALGTEGIGLPMDGDRNGVVDTADYYIFRDHLGSLMGPPALLAVPEPGTALLLTWLLLAIVPNRHRSLPASERSGSGVGT